jgi:hypothetical protein
VDSYEPHSLIGLVGLVVIVLGAALAASLPVAVPLWLNSRRQKQFHADMGAVKDQVVNGHGDRNLRTDVDRIIDAVEATQQSVAELRGEMRGLTHRVDQISQPRRTGW